MVNVLWVKQEFTSGISVSKMAVKTLKMTNPPERTPQHINWWKRRKSERNGHERSPIYNQRSCWWCWHIDWLRPWNFFEFFGYETRGSKICSKIVEFWTKTAANGSCSVVTKWSQRWCRITETYYNRWRNMGLRM